MFDLRGKKAVVTGASRGIGRAMAIALTTYGADTLCVARSLSDLEQTAELANDSRSGTAYCLSADLREQEGILTTILTAERQIGGINILVNAAAADFDSEVENIPDEVWHNLFTLNVEAAFRLCKAASTLLKENGGKVINVASAFGIVGARNSTAYTASKHAVVGFTRALALEWARSGVQVNALAPGFIRTDMTENLWSNPEGSKWVVNRTPIGRWGLVDDLVGPTIFLASGASDFMTGQVITIDG